jgi:hypothetical protein
MNFVRLLTSKFIYERENISFEVITWEMERSFDWQNIMSSPGGPRLETPL